jgi:hypothetical protein
MEDRPESQKFAVDASKPDPDSDFTIGDAVAVQYTRWVWGPVMMQYLADSRKQAVAALRYHRSGVFARHLFRILWGRSC